MHKSLGNILLTCALSFTVAGQFLAPALAASGADRTFGSLYGEWRGRGIIVPSKDKPAEKISCRVSYARISDRYVSSMIRCSAVDFKINARGRVSFSKTSGMFHGVLEDSGTGWTLRLSGGRARSKGVRFGLKIPEAKVNGWLSINVTGRRSHSWVAQRATSGGLKQLLKIKFRR